MYQSLENAVRIEAAKANTAVMAAYSRMSQEMAEPHNVAVGFLEELATAQAALTVWTKLNLIADRFAEQGSDRVSQRLVFATRKLRDELVEDYEVMSTNPWVVAEARTIRKAKVEIYAILSEFVD